MSLHDLGDELLAVMSKADIFLITVASPDESISGSSFLDRESIL
jgi:hypothetical protein